MKIVWRVIHPDNIEYVTADEQEAIKASVMEGCRVYESSVDWRLVRPMLVGSIG